MYVLFNFFFIEMRMRISLYEQEYIYRNNNVVDS